MRAAWKNAGMRRHRDASGPRAATRAARRAVRARAAGLLLVVGLIAVPAAEPAADFFIDPILLEEPDVAAEIVPPPPARGYRPASIGVRVRNVGPIPVALAGVELLARWPDGTSAGTVAPRGELPAALAPGDSTLARFRWSPAGDPPAAGDPVLFFACASIAGTDVQPENDCDFALRTAWGREARIVVDDDFEAQGPWWEWWQSGTGSHALAGGVAALTVGEASHSGEYSDAEINDYRRGPERGFPWGPGLRVEIRARASDGNGITSPDGRGTRGFGFWNLGTGGPGAPDGMTNAWFISVSPESFGSFGLFAATVFDGGNVRLMQPLAAAMQNWHDYGIVWTKGGVTFSVDGRPVAATPVAPSEKLGFVAWIDNYRLTLGPGGITTSFLDLDHDQTLFVDRIRIWSLDPRAGKRPR